MSHHLNHAVSSHTETPAVTLVDTGYVGLRDGDMSMVVHVAVVHSSGRRTKEEGCRDPPPGPCYSVGLRRERVHSARVGGGG